MAHTAVDAKFLVVWPHHTAVLPVRAHPHLRGSCGHIGTNAAPASREEEKVDWPWEEWGGKKGMQALKMLDI